MSHSRSPPPPDPIYQISNDQSYQEVGRPQLLNSLRNKYQGATGTTATVGLPAPPADTVAGARARVLVPNLKPKPAAKLTESQNLYYSEVSESQSEKVVFYYYYF